LGGEQKSSSLSPCLGTTYVLSGCCKNTEHVSNRLSGELAAEFAGAEKCLLEAAALGDRTGLARIINLLSFFGSGESPPQDLTTVDGTSIWGCNGIHLTSNASRVAARKLMADLASGGEEGEPVNKRAKLESVVPAPAPAKKRTRQRANRRPRRPDPSRRQRHYGSPASCHRLSVDEDPGADPAARTPPRGEGDRYAVIAAAAAAEQTRGREGRSEAASAAAGAQLTTNKRKVILKPNRKSERKNPFR
jgi:hypothetical protein